MLPRWHIVFGAVFALLIWIFAPGISFTYLFIIFLSSILIDLDHYINAVIKGRKIGLLSAFEYHKELGKVMGSDYGRGIRKKYDFHLFHTLEFILLTGIIGIFIEPFLYIFIGMVFHSLLDLLYLINKDYLYAREYFFFNWLSRKV